MRISPILSLTLGFVWVTGSGYGLEQLTPKDQVIRSGYHVPILAPIVSKHRFDPRRPARIAEPYSPEILVTGLVYPDQLPKNIRLSWLTQLSGPLAGLFLGDQGVFERGLSAYADEDYLQAQHFLLQLTKKKGPLQLQANLWLAWSFYKSGMPQLSQPLAVELANQATGDIQREGYFLWLMQTLQQGDLKTASGILPNLNRDIPAEAQDFRIRYLSLVAQVKIGHWQDARKTLNALDTQKIRYSPFYPKLKELAGAIAYYENDFRRGLAEFKRAKAADPRAFAQGENTRHIAWLLYFIGEYEQTIAQVDLELAQLRPTNRDELFYLKIAALTHLGRGGQVQTSLSQLPKDSPFKGYGAFQIKVFLKGLSQWPQLNATVSKVKLKDKDLQFYATILDGNQQFLQKQFPQARSSYTKALKAARTDELKWLALYNLSVANLALSRWDDAKSSFAQLDKLPAPENRKWFSYHQLYLDFHLNDLSSFLARYQGIDFSELDQDIQWEVHRLKASLLVQNKRADEAIQPILWGVDHGYPLESLSYAAQILYGQNKFEPLLHLLAQHRTVRSDLLLSYEVRCLMALGRHNQAQVKLDFSPLKSDLLLALQVDLWTQAKAYPKVIATLNTRLDEAGHSEAQQTAYSRMLADAYFNQKDYPQARFLYQQALDQSSDPAEQSNLIYSLVLSRYLEKGQPGFKQKAKSALQSPALEAPTRLSLTLLLSGYFTKNDQPQETDKLLAEYERNHLYHIGQIRVLRTQLALKDQKWAACSELADNPPAQSTPFERIDLKILGAECDLEQSKGKQAQERLTKSPTPSDYRRSEAWLLSALASRQQNKTLASEQQFAQVVEADLSERQLVRLRLSSTANRLELGEPARALAQLGDFRDYPNKKDQRKALGLTAQIKSSQGRFKEAAKDTLRLSYSPGLPKAEQVEVQIQLVALYLKADMHQKAGQLITKLKESAEPLNDKQSAELLTLESLLPGSEK